MSVYAMTMGLVVLLGTVLSGGLAGVIGVSGSMSVLSSAEPAAFVVWAVVLYGLRRECMQAVMPRPLHLLVVLHGILAWLG